MRSSLLTVFSLCLLFASNTSVAQNPDSSGVYKIVEQMPEYPGGLESLMREVTARVVYPQSCIDSNIQGKVYVQFIVNEDGTISDIKGVGNSHPDLKSAAKEATKGIQNFFKPGIHNGKPVRVYTIIPIAFKFALGPTKPVVDSTEQPPKFPGGDMGILQFLKQNIKYPKNARLKEIGGKVLLRFVVLEDGSISDITVVKSVYPSLDQEAVRVVKMLPKFSPAIQMGKPVKTYFNLPVVFRL